VGLPRSEILSLTPVEGVRLGTARAGIKQPGRRDLVVMELAEGTHCAAVFTRNAFCAAPVTVARRHLAASKPRFFVINTGYANAGTGNQGIQDAELCCALVADLGHCAPQAVLPFSTGVIGEPLPMAVIRAGLPEAFANLSPTAWFDAACGIMTTDTVPKVISRQVQIEGERLTVTGIAKGAGMIRPDMATMLAFLATDVCLDGTLLQRCLTDAVARSFNRITVDGDTSTNDACVLVATSRGTLSVLDAKGMLYETLCEALLSVCTDLAKAIVRDGEGATKFITIEVWGGASEAECLEVAYSIAHSPLVKTAFFAADPNWGRILAAVGRAPVYEFNVRKVALYLDNLCIVREGSRAPEYREEAGCRVMAQDEIRIGIELGRGTARTRVWTCDLSHEYVRINAEYRT
jgi:glutamate N-acetyltransferase/amino-acid acetyltransferase